MNRFNLKTQENRDAYKAALLEGYTVQNLEDLGLTIGTKEENSRFFLKIFKGKAGNPSHNYFYRTAESRQAEIERVIESAERSKAYKAEQKAKRGTSLSGVALTAKKIRERLKVEFPSVKFSVKSSSFSMGDSVNISWTDGPIEKLVEYITNEYQNSTFDSMTDYSNYHGVDSEKLGCTGAKYVSCSREQSAELQEDLKAQYMARYPGLGLDNFTPWKYERENPFTWSEEYQEKRAEQQAEIDAAYAVEVAKREAEYAEEQKKSIAIDEQIQAKIDEVQELHPYSENDRFYVSILWSEKCAMHDISSESKNSQKLSPKAADILFNFADVQLNTLEAGYFKTKFEIFDNSESVYTGRYDLGDLDGGLFVHILSAYAGTSEESQVIELVEAMKNTEQPAPKSEGKIICFATYTADKQAQAEAEEIKAEQEQAEAEFQEMIMAIDLMTISQLVSMCTASDMPKDLRRFICQEVYKLDEQRGKELYRRIKQAT